MSEDEVIYPADHAVDTTAHDAIPVAPELVVSCRRQALAGGVSAIISGVGTVLTFIAATSGTNRAGGSGGGTGWGVAFVALLIVLVFAAFFALQQWKVARVLTGAVWRTSTHTAKRVGYRRSAKVVVQLDATRRTYRTWWQIGRSSALCTHSTVWWAGEPEGLIVVRVPGRLWMTLLKPLHVRPRERRAAPGRAI